jgi:hypothetical protein
MDQEKTVRFDAPVLHGLVRAQRFAEHRVEWLKEQILYRDIPTQKIRLIEELDAWESLLEWRAPPDVIAFVTRRMVELSNGQETAEATAWSVLLQAAFLKEPLRPLPETEGPQR